MFPPFQGDGRAWPCHEAVRRWSATARGSHPACTGSDPRGSRPPLTPPRSPLQRPSKGPSEPPGALLLFLIGQLPGRLTSRPGVPIGNGCPQRPVPRHRRPAAPCRAGVLSAASCVPRWRLPGVPPVRRCGGATEPGPARSNPRYCAGPGRASLRCCCAPVAPCGLAMALSAHGSASWRADARPPRRAFARRAPAR